MKTVVLAHPDGDRVELYIDAPRIDWVHLPRRKPPRREQMVYERAEDLERALLVRFGDLTKRGYTVAEVAPRGYSALAVEPEVLEHGLQPFWSHKASAAARAENTALAELEAATLVALAPVEQQAIVPHVPALHGFVTGMGYRTLVLDGNPARRLRSIVPEATGVPPHRAWLRAWLDSVHAAPGALQMLVLRNCRLFDFDAAELASRLEPFEHLGFVAGFPSDFACASHARSLTLGLHDPESELPDAAREALANADLAVERLAIENAIENQPIPENLVAALARASLPRLRELAVTGVSPGSFIVRLVTAPLLERLRVVRLDARFYPGDVDVIAKHAAALRHLERLEIGFLPGSVTDGLAALQQALPIATELVGALPVCPY